MVALVERDTFSNDGIAQRIPCSSEGISQFDLVVPGGDISQYATIAVSSLKTLEDLGVVDVVT